MNKNGKIRSNVVKESLLDYNNLADTLKENTTNAVRDLLSEAVRDTYSKILAEADEDDDKDYDVEEVEDTDSPTEDSGDSTDDTAAETDDAADADDSQDSGSTDDTNADDDDENVTSDEGVDDNGDLTGETTASGEDEDGSEWSDFDKYKVSDDEYDLTNADDSDIVKVYKLLNNDDQVVVQKSDDGKVDIKDNETGSEYLIDLGDDSDDDIDGIEDESNCSEGNDCRYGDDDDYIRDDYAEDGMDYDPDEDDDDEENDDDNMNESRLFEIALDEYNSNVGYTDNYQNKSPMELKGLAVADDKDKNDWGSKGLRSRDNGKPWSGKKNDAKENQPFTAAKGKTVEEEDVPEGGDAGADATPTVEEGANLGGRRGAVGGGRTTGNKSHMPKVSGTGHPYGQHHVSVAGKYQGDKYTGEGAADDASAQNESIRRKANKIFRENKELKIALGKFKNVLKEAAVTNVNLGQIIKLISENATSQDEKKEIIERFGKEAKTVQESKNLYESISRDLQKKQKLNITEDKQYSAEGSKQINETQIYQSKDLMESLDLMHRLCK